jgi:hypothetical protein
MSQAIKCPSRAIPKHAHTVFLAGSIEMNAAEDWQTKVQNQLKDTPFTFFNPRRDDWDDSWKQTLDDKNFVEQVEWELERLEECKTVFMYFDPKTKSPISLLEFGMYARCNPEKLIVACPEGFWRKGNLQVTGRKYGVKIYDTLEDAVTELKRKIK